MATARSHECEYERGASAAAWLGFGAGFGSQAIARLDSCWPKSKSLLALVVTLSRELDNNVWLSLGSNANNLVAFCYLDF